MDFALVAAYEHMSAQTAEISELVLAHVLDQRFGCDGMEVPDMFLNQPDYLR
jgi:hypothetical protein